MRLEKVAMWVCLVIVFAMGVSMRLQHPDMTETRLFLTFWPRYVLAIGVALVAVGLSRLDRKR